MKISILMYINDIRKQEYEDWGIYSINISGVKSVKYGGGIGH